MYKSSALMGLLKNQPSQNLSLSVYISVVVAAAAAAMAATLEASTGHSTCGFIFFRKKNFSEFNFDLGLENVNL